MTASLRDTREFDLPSNGPWYPRLPVLTLESAHSPLESDDIAGAAMYMLNQPLNISVKALDVVPSGKFMDQRLANS